MARTVADAAILLGVLVAQDKLDPTTAESRKGSKDYTKYLEADGLKGARIGVARAFIDPTRPLGKLIEPYLQLLKDAGATLVDVYFPTVENFGQYQTEVLLYEFKTDLNKYLAARNAPYKTLAELIKFNEENKAKEMPIFGQELFLQAQEKGDLTDEKYLKALQLIKNTTQYGINSAIEKNNLDAIVSPTSGTWGMAAIAGYPYITVPAGFVDGIPAGFAFFGKAFSEPTLIKFAYAFEQKTKKREAPKYLATLA